MLEAAPFRGEGRVITTGTTGVASWVEETGRKYEVTVERYLSENRRWSPRGYEERNKRIAEDCGELYCIFYFDSTHSLWIADYAEKIGKKTIRIEVQGG